MTKELEIKLLSENATMPREQILQIADQICMYQKQQQSKQEKQKQLKQTWLLIYGGEIMTNLTILTGRITKDLVLKQAGQT